MAIFHASAASRPPPPMISTGARFPEMAPTMGAPVSACTADASTTSRRARVRSYEASEASAEAARRSRSARVKAPVRLPAAVIAAVAATTSDGDVRTTTPQSHDAAAARTSAAVPTSTCARERWVGVGKASGIRRGAVGVSGE